MGGCVVSIVELIVIICECNIIEVWNCVLDSVDGCFVVWLIFECCNLFWQIYWGNDFDGFWVGQCDIGLIVLNEWVFLYDVQIFLNMQMEYVVLMECIECVVEQEVEKENFDE